jgi:hypothetical protein
MFSVVFVVVFGVAVVTSVVYLDSSIVMEQGIDNLPLSERVIMAVHNGGMRYVLPWAGIALSVVPIAAVVGWLVHGRRRACEDSARVVLGTWLQALALSLCLGYGALIVGAWSKSVPLLMGAMLIGPAYWALSGALYSALSVEQGRRVSEGGRLPVMALAALTLIWLVVDALFVGGMLSWAVAVVPGLVWWESRNDRLTRTSITT